MDGDDARLAEMDLATIPDDTAGAVRALDTYDWRSDEARATFEAIKQMLQREVLDAQFAGMKRMLEDGDPEAMQAVKDMLADLNELLAAHARGEDTDRPVPRVHGQARRPVPGEPGERRRAHRRPRPPAGGRRPDDGLAAARAARAARPADERGAVRPGPGLADGAALRQPARPAARSRPGPGADGRDRGEGLGYSAAVEAVAELADLEALEQQLAESAFGSPLDDVDVDALERHLGSEAAADLRALRELERELERQGFVSQGDDGLRLTPRAVRRLGETALRRVFAQIDAAGAGDHDDRRTGAADEPTGLTRPWEFGDDLPIDAVRTVSNAVQDGAALGSGGRPARRGLRGRRDRASGPAPRWRCASTCRSRWSTRAAGGR